jgi:hypothetical protein
MRAAGLIAIAILAAPIAGARAESFEVQDIYRRTEALVQSLLGPGRNNDREVIAPPGDIDPKMAFEPRAAGTMRIIRPPERSEQRR